MPKKAKKPINLGFCPRCKSNFPMMTREIDGVVFCYLCSFNIEEDRMERQNWVSWAKEYAKNMMP